MEASRTPTLGAEHCNPLDIAFASQVDRFDFAMEVTIDDIDRRHEIRIGNQNNSTSKCPRPLLSARPRSSRCS